MIWVILLAFFLCNCLLVWGVFRQRRDPFDLPRVMHEGWFRSATMLGGVGWMVVPAMCFSAFGFLGAVAGIVGYVASSALIAASTLSAVDGGISPVSG